MLGIGAASMMLFIVFRGAPGWSHLAFLVWGTAFGPLVTMFQAAVSKQVDSGRDAATSVQSSTFNLSIMIASYVGGALQTRSSAMGIVHMAMYLFIAAALIAVCAKRTIQTRVPSAVAAQPL